MTKFSDLKLDPKVLKAIAEAGYETPTPIQAGAIPPALEGRDVLGIAQTGTGKTASFTLPMITLLGRGRARARMPRSLVLCPTRELAAQVAENFDVYAKHTRLTKALLIGGVSFTEQDKLIDRGVDVLIATPGRLLDHFERGKLLLTGVQIMVVDEADRMLDMGFIPDIERIFQLTPFTRQTLFFSATMAPEIERITNTFLHSPERVEVARQATTSETITQRLIEITPSRRDQSAKQKRDLLRALIDAEGEKLTNAIIFCNRKTDVDIVSKSLQKHGYDAAALHGDLDQSHRTRTLEGFRDGKLKLLVASDVAARGLDIPAVSHVFNFDLPSHAEDYVHRIGRTGRAGRLGSAFSIATPADEKYLAAIENLVKQTLPRAELPEGFTFNESTRTERDDRRGSRDRRGRGNRDDKSSGSDRQQEQRPELQKAERQEDRQQDRRQDRQQDRNQDRSDNRHDNRNDNRGDRRGRGRGDDHRGPVIVGMGDHVPEFMLVEIRTSLAKLNDDAPETVETPEVSSEAAPEQPRSRRGRGRRQASPAPVVEEVIVETAAPLEAEVVDTTVAEAAAAPLVEEAPAEVAPTEEAVVAPKPRARRKKAEPAAEGEVAAPAEDTEAAPKKRAPRRRTAKVEGDATVETAEKPAPKPRARRTKAAEAPAEVEGEPAAPAPKRTRRKKADVVTEQGPETEA